MRARLTTKRAQNEFLLFRTASATPPHTHTKHGVGKLATGGQ
jgi:hypothetical protein